MLNNIFNAIGRLITMVRNNDITIVTSHKNSDPDALASTFYIYNFVKNMLHKDT